MKISTLLIMSPLLALAACSSKAPPPAEAQAPPPPPQKTVFDTQLKALDKAKAVQGVVDQQKTEADRKTKEQEDGG